MPADGDVDQSDAVLTPADDLVGSASAGIPPRTTSPYVNAPREIFYVQEDRVPDQIRSAYKADRFVHVYPSYTPKTRSRCGPLRDQADMDDEPLHMDGARRQNLNRSCDHAHADWTTAKKKKAKSPSHHPHCHLDVRNV